MRSPPWLWEEVASRYTWLQAKSGLPGPALDVLLRQVRARIIDIPADLVEAFRAEALQRVPRAGRKDAPHVAATLAVGGTLWTHDSTFAQESYVPTVTTADLMDLL